MRVSTYSVSGKSGFFVEVDAHRGRCTAAPLAASASQRGPENTSRNIAYASWPWATAAVPTSARASGLPSASRRRSTSVSTLLMKKLATELIPDRSDRPAATASSRPARYASMTAA
jgi:hypothetical protein